MERIPGLVVFVLRCVVLCCAMLCCVVLCCAVLCCVVLCCVVLCCVVLCCVVLCCVVLCCVVLCCVVLCCVVLCCVVLCCVVLCCVVLCCVVLCSLPQQVYELIFKKIGSGLGPDLPLYSMGLFPLFQNASTQIKPKLIEMYEAYYVPLGAVALAACIDGLVASILYGLEEENTKTYASTKKLLDSMCHAFLPEPALFYKALWKAIYINPQVPDSPGPRLGRGSEGAPERAGG